MIVGQVHSWSNMEKPKNNALSIASVSTSNSGSGSHPQSRVVLFLMICILREDRKKMYRMTTDAKSLAKILQTKFPRLTDRIEPYKVSTEALRYLLLNHGRVFREVGDEKDPGPREFVLNYSAESEDLNLLFPESE